MFGFEYHVGASAKQASQMDYLLQHPGCVISDFAVGDLLGDPGAAEKVHSKRADGLSAKAGGAV